MRGVLASLCLLPALFSACSSSDEQPVAVGGTAGVAGKPSAGAGGTSSAGASGESGESGASGAAELAGDAGAGDTGAAGAAGPSGCAESGQGDIELVVSGLPASIAANVSIAGPHAALESESITLRHVPGGSYSVGAKRVYDDNALVRAAYDAQISSPTFCLDDGGTQTVDVSYQKVAPSNQLWTHNGDQNAPLLGFAASALTTSGSPTATSRAKLPIGGAFAFDREGNLWAAGASAAQPTVARYAAAWLAGVGVPLSDFAYNLALDCSPKVEALALDSSGNVWLSACGKRVLRIDRPDATPGAAEEPIDIAANVTLSGFSEQNEDLAFDSAGNLWVAAGGRVLRFDRARLVHDDAGAPDLALEVTSDDATPQPLSASFLAFDVAGNLWASDLAAKAVLELDKAMLEQRGTSTVAAKVRVSLDVQALDGRPAFDDEGSLWLSLSAGKFAKVTAEQLAVSSSASAPTVPALVIASPDLSDAGGLAFFPAASGLPLPSAQP
jgi:hypothetical protein